MLCSVCSYDPDGKIQCEAMAVLACPSSSSVPSLASTDINDSSIDLSNSSCDNFQALAKLIGLIPRCAAVFDPWTQQSHSKPQTLKVEERPIRPGKDYRFTWLMPATRPEALFAGTLIATEDLCIWICQVPVASV